MSALLPTSSPLYLKRLARECNALPDGFYANGFRYTSARFRAGGVYGRRILPDGRASWELIEDDPVDAYGRGVYASRTP